MSWCIWSLLSGHPTMMYPFNCCKCSSCVVVCCICWIDMYSGTFVDVYIASTLMSMPCIASFLFSIWFCLDSQSAMNICNPGLYIILTQYWCIFRRIHLILCDRVAMSFLNIATRGLQSVIYNYLPRKSIMMKCFETMQYTQCFSFNVAIPFLSTGQAFACKCDWSQNGVIWSNIFCPCFTISSLWQGSTMSYPNISVLRYKGLVSL